MNEYDKQHRNYERRIRPLFLNTTRKQIQPVIRWLELNPGLPPVDALIESQVYRKPMILAYQTVGVLAAKREYSYQRKNDVKGIFDLLSDVWSEIINGYVADYAYRISNELSQTTIREIQNALKYGYEQSMNNNQLASYIRKRVQGEISRSRATLIARTEATTAANLGKEEGAKTYYKEQNIQGYKLYIGRNDVRERSDHLVLNDTLIPIEDNFDFGGELAQRPGALTLSANQRCNCRCTVQYMSERAAIRYRERNN